MRQSKKMRLMREDLRYWQTQVRLARRSLAGAEQKVKAIAGKMREEQRRLKPSENAQG